jgi:hypothetical protein
LLAIRALDGEIFDLIERHPEDLYSLIVSPRGPLANDSEVVLELVDPISLKRVSVSWPYVKR